MTKAETISQGEQQKVTELPKADKSRTALLSSIKSGTKLKKAQTNDKSKPAIGGKGMQATLANPTFLYANTLSL